MTSGAIRVAIAVALDLATTTASAQVPGEPSPATFAQRPLVVHAILGPGTAVGLVGADIELNVFERLAAGLGGGVGPGGLQCAVLARGRPLLWANPARALAVTVDVAMSLGGFRSVEYYLPASGNEHYVPDPQHEFIGTAYWMQADIGFERRNGNGTSSLVTAGLGWILNPASGYCKDDASGARAPCRSDSLGDTPSLRSPRILLTGAIGHDFL